jgi:hypothetical protein
VQDYREEYSRSLYYLHIVGAANPIFLITGVVVRAKFAVINAS